MSRCLALLGPGLDGLLAMELARRAGVEVVAATMRSPFTVGREASAASAARLDVPLLMLDANDALFERLKHPRFGYTREMEPALDIKVWLLTAARQRMNEAGAQFLLSGDVVGQRLPGQSKRDLALVDFHAEVEGLVVRPLSGKLLPPTVVECQGLLSRGMMLDLQGRSRKPQLALAASFGWTDLPAVSSGSLLAEPAFAARFRDALEHGDATSTWPLLRFGRHFRLRAGVKALLGRNTEENEALAQVVNTIVIAPHNFTGPTALLLGDANDGDVQATAALLVQHRKKSQMQAPFTVSVALSAELSTIVEVQPLQTRLPKAM